MSLIFLVNYLNVLTKILFANISRFFSLYCCFIRSINYKTYPKLFQIFTLLASFSSSHSFSGSQFLSKYLRH